MEFLVMANVQTCGIGNYRSSLFGCSLETRSERKSWVLDKRKLRFGGETYAILKEESSKPLVGGGILEKELEFEPSFDEYLKAMESVKSGRDVKYLEKSNKFKSKDVSREKDGSRTWNLGRDKSKKREDLNGKINIVNRPQGEFHLKKNVIRKLKEKVTDDKGSDRRWLNNRKNGIEPEAKVTYLDKRAKFGNGQESVSKLVDVGRSRSATVYKRDKHVNDRSSSKSFGMQGESFEEERFGFRSREKPGGTFDNNFTQFWKADDNEIKQSSRKLITKSKSVHKKDEYSLEVERAAFSNFEECNDVMDKPRIPRMEMEERIQRLARRLNGADIDMPEWMFSMTMRSARIRFSDHSILRVIQILGKLGNWRRVIQVIEWLQMRERFKSNKLRFIYTAALSVLGKARRPVEALNVFHAMQQQMSSYPDSVAYHCIAVTLGQAGHLKELFDVIDSMRSLPKKKFKTITHERWDPRLEPDIVVYNAVLNACARRKQWEGAFWVLEQLKKHGQKPSATTYGLVMEVMLASGKYNLVHEFFRKVEKSFIPNALAYKVLLNTLWREGKTDEAILAVQDMERQGIVGSAALYYDLARCLCSAGRCEEALMQMEKICKVANKPLVVTYTGLIQACLESGNIKNATYIFDQMKNFCSPNLVTCNVMLKAYLEHGLFEEAKKLFQKMLENGNQIRNESDYKVLAIPDAYTFNSLLDACIAEKRWDDLEHVYKKMLHYGYHFNAKRHLRIVLDALRAGKVELLEMTWTHLAKSQRVPPPPLIKERFCIMLEKEDYVSALSCLTSHPVSELRDFSKIGWLNLLNENSLRFGEHTLARLMQEATVFANGSDIPNPALQNLISSCKEFLETKTADSKLNMRDSLLYSSN